MRFLQLIPFASFALGIPYVKSKTNGERQSCYSDPWAVQQFHTCTNCTIPDQREATTLSFLFSDSNFNPVVTAECGISLLPGGSLINFNWTPCGSGVSFQWGGSSLTLRRTNVDCRK